MNPEKIGQFIKSLREEKKMTQQNLAEIIHIGRQAISKWELGKTMPDHSALLKLSEIFKVSIDELLAGEKNSKNNVALILYKESRKKTKTIRFSIMLIVFLILLFLGYYFFNQYNSIKVYTITGGNDVVTIENGLFIKTKEKIYFNIGNINSKSDIKKIDLIYKNDDNEISIYSSDSTQILLMDYYGYEEYFKFDELKLVIDNLYIQTYIGEEKYTIKLDLIEDYKNDNILFIRKKRSIENEIQIDNLINSTMIEKIKDEFNLENNIYTKNYKNKNYLETFNYYDDIVLLNIAVSKNNLTLEEWNYNLRLNYLTYINYEENYSFNYRSAEKYECLYGNCNNYLIKIKEFKEKIEKI